LPLRHRVPAGRDPPRPFGAGSFRDHGGRPGERAAARQRTSISTQRTRL